uniref:Uncharacterized protein n=1 Tax=Varanus komodoensis TaxID=61221 RepID=A0A8D2IHY2_VARKO
MAADQPLSEDLACPVCHEGFTEPVRIACGHTFCRACLLQCWGAADGERAACPRCGRPFREGDVRPDEDLAELVAKAKGREEGAEAGDEPGLCGRHQQPLRLFCREEQSLICRVCDNSKEHKGHKDVVPAEEIAQGGQVAQIAYSNNEVTEVASAVPAPPQFADVEEEVKCPICHEYLTNAVSVDCGHNYCQTCILRHCSMKEDFGEEVTCPLCQAPIQRENIRPNWPLRNLVEMIKHFPLRLPEENLCTKHEKKLSLFCTEDGELVCIHCKRSSEHRAHNVLLLEEAVEQYKEQSQSHLEFLKKEKKKLEEQKRAKEWRIENCLVQLEQEKKRIRSDFERMQKFLEEKQQLWVDQLEELEEELKKMQDKHLAKVSKEFSRLTALVAEMEEMCLQPESKFLQDTRNALGRCEKKVGCVVNLSPGLEEMLRIHLQKSSDLRMHMRNCKGRGSILWGVGRMPGF